MVLVTGGTGFLGSHLLKALIEEGVPVRSIYRKKILQHVAVDIATKVEWVQADILDVSILPDLMKEVTVVYHCAGMISFNPGMQDQLRKVNVEGTANIVNAALDASVQKLVHVSSAASLGRARPGTGLDETKAWEEDTNNSYYGYTKYLGEMEVWRGVAEGLQAVIVNPTIMLGKGDWSTGSLALVKQVFDEFPYYSKGINGFVDVEDVVRAMILLMNQEIQSERFILNAENWSYLDLFTEMARKMGKRPPHRQVKPWLAEWVWRTEKIKSRFQGRHPLITRETARTALLELNYDNSKIRKFLAGFSFQPLEHTLDRVCQSYLADLRKKDLLPGS
ncbi:MAG: NAD-dependent epimerase/dehydratase family protein [Chitinophagaceae bacterium]